MVSISTLTSGKKGLSQVWPPMPPPSSKGGSGREIPLPCSVAFVCRVSAEGQAPVGQPRCPSAGGAPQACRPQHVSCRVDGWGSGGPQPWPASPSALEAGTSLLCTCRLLLNYGPEWPPGSRVQRPLAGHLPGTVGLSSPQPGHGASRVVPLAGWLFQESLFGQEAL